MAKIDELSIEVVSNGEIKELISNVIEDVKTVRESDVEVKDRLAIEIMALNAVANAYEKTK